jgi:hypothetical protein
LNIDTEFPTQYPAEMSPDGIRANKTNKMETVKFFKWLLEVNLREVSNEDYINMLTIWSFGGATMKGYQLQKPDWKSTAQTGPSAPVTKSGNSSMPSNSQSLVPLGMVDEEIRRKLALRNKAKRERKAANKLQKRGTDHELVTPTSPPGNVKRNRTEPYNNTGAVNHTDSSRTGTGSKDRICIFDFCFVNKINLSHMNSEPAPCKVNQCKYTHSAVYQNWGNDRKFQAVKQKLSENPANVEIVRKLLKLNEDQI